MSKNKAALSNCRLCNPSPHTHIDLHLFLKPMYQHQLYSDSSSITPVHHTHARARALPCVYQILSPYLRRSAIILHRGRPPPPPPRVWYLNHAAAAATALLLLPLLAVASAFAVYLSATILKVCVRGRRHVLRERSKWRQRGRPGTCDQAGVSQRRRYRDRHRQRPGPHRQVRH